MEQVMLTESMEDYLEMIYRLYGQLGYVRPVDLAEAIGVQPSSVTRMIQKLDEAGFLVYEKYRHVALTPQGLRYGQFLSWRDETLKDFLAFFGEKVGVDAQVEGIEHYLTPTTMCIFRNLLDYFRARPYELATFLTLKQMQSYPEGIELGLLRAQLFKHSQDGEG